MTRSTLFALLVLALIQVALALPFGYHKIFNVAANGVLKGGYAGTVPTVDENVQDGPFAMWGIDALEDGASIFMPPAGSFLNAVKGQVIVKGGPFKWVFQNAGYGQYLIKLPYDDLVLDWDEGTRKVSLRPADGSDTQLWQVPTSHSYSRMYYQ
ncbi:hypothetical protein BGZ68_007512 [Mortierella alpina]|nr:hypothetical protein BGZ68_007512 [Mortierella alpina]